MTLQLNGEPREVPAAIANVSQLMDHLGFAPRTVMVEHNGLALRPDEWPARAVRAGDQLEVIRIVAGG